MGTQPTTQQVTQWQAWLTEAQAAYQQLMVGGMAVEVNVDGNTFATRFAKPDADRLEAWISKLQGWIAAATGCGARGGAIGMVF